MAQTDNTSGVPLLALAWRTVPTRTFTHAAVAPVPVDTAWFALQDPATWGAIGGVDEVYGAHHADDGTLVSYRFRASAGGQTYEGRARTSFAEPHRMMVVDVDTPELEGRITVTLEGGNPHTEVAVELTVRSKGMLATLFFPVVAAAIASGFPTSVEDFAGRLAG